MITAEKLMQLIGLGPKELTALIRKAGYKEDKFLTAEFLGMTNGGQFCYKCLYPGEFKDICKVFVSMDSTGKIRAEY